MPAATSYELEYAVNAGPELGPGVTETHTVLKLDRAQHTAFLERHRTPEDRPGETIGTFLTQLPDETFARVLALADAARLTSLPAATGGGPGTSMLRLRLRRGDRVTETTFTNRDAPILDQLDALLVALHEISANLHGKPLQALAATVAYERGAFQVRLENIGTKTLCVADPRSLGSEDDDRWAGVRIAEYPPEVPGFTAPPLEWSRLGLVQAPGATAQPPPVVLAPGQQIVVVTVPWLAPTKGMRHLVQAVVSNYSGPPEINGCFHLRGAVFSKDIEITP